LQYAFPVSAGNYEVNLYLGNSYGGTSQPGQRVFDVSVEGVVPATYNNIDPVARFGNLSGGRLSYVTPVNDGELNIEFLHGIENPLINGIEIVALRAGAGGPTNVNTTVSLPEFPRQSGTLIVEQHNGADRIWNVNPDNDTVSVSTPHGQLVAEIAVGDTPWSVAKSPQSSHVYVTNKNSATISIINSVNLTLESTIVLVENSQPHGVTFNSSGSIYYVLHEATRVLQRRNANSHGIVGSITLAGTPRHLSMAYDDSVILVSNFITPPAPGEHTGSVDIANAAAEIFVIDPDSMALLSTIEIPHDNTPFGEFDGPGLANYLGAPAITFDSQAAYVPHKKDNIDSGALRGKPGMSFDHTVRAQTSRVLLPSASADNSFRLDHENASVATSAALSGDGRYLLVTLETSRELVVYDTVLGFELMRAKTGRAPQTVALSSDGSIAYVHNFMDRTISRFDLSVAFAQAVPFQNELPLVNVVNNEQLSADVLLGKQFFYDADDNRLARDGYMSCAACHKEGKHDGRVWDLTQFGEGLRNTTSLLGKAGTGQGFLHWSGNFDEVQDFEGQIRNFAGGSGLMSDAAFNAGTRSQPLGDTKAGLSRELDALAAYLESLDSIEESPFRGNSLTSEGQIGQQLFNLNNCSSCHSGSLTTDSQTGKRSNVGTINANSGNRSNGFLDGFDTPTLSGLWASAPYLHNGSSATIANAIRAHSVLGISQQDADRMAQFLREFNQGDLP